MLSPPAATWTVRGATFALWALAAASVVFWGLKLAGGSGEAAAPPLPVRQVPPADPVAVARLLGAVQTQAAAASAPSLASRFQLLGVAAGASSGEGAAVIGVDGKPARSYRVGSLIEEGLSLQSVHGRTATLGPPNGGAAVVLELPQLRK